MLECRQRLCRSPQWSTTRPCRASFCLCWEDSALKNVALNAFQQWTDSFWGWQPHQNHQQARKHVFSCSTTSYQSPPLVHPPWCRLHGRTDSPWPWSNEVSEVFGNPHGKKRKRTGKTLLWVGSPLCTPHPSLVSLPWVHPVKWRGKEFPKDTNWVCQQLHQFSTPPAGLNIATVKRRTLDFKTSQWMGDIQSRLLSDLLSVLLLPLFDLWQVSSSNWLMISFSYHEKERVPTQSWNLQTHPNHSKHLKEYVESIKTDSPLGNT